MSTDAHLSALLDERARRLARPASPPVSSAGADGLVAFDVGDERFLLPAAAIGEVLPALRPGLLPGVPGWVEGIVGVRGRVMPLVRLDRVIGGLSASAEETRSSGACIVLIGAPLALHVDRLLGIRPRPVERADPLPPGSPAELQSMAAGTIGDRIVIDPERMVQVIAAGIGGATAPHAHSQQGGKSPDASQR